MGDAFASPLYADAMIRSRESIIDPAETGPRWTLKQRNVADGHNHIYRWEPWVRSYLTAQECVESMEFQIEQESSSEKKETVDDVSVTLTIFDHQSRKRAPLFRIVRPRQDVFEAQIEQVLWWAELRAERTTEILTQIDNQHSFWGAIVPIHADRMRYTRELVDAAVQMAVMVQMRFKHELACWRPADYSYQVQPMITTPGHGTLPSGHCTQAYLVAEILKHMIGSMGTDAASMHVNRQLDRLAQRISNNRVIAGVHFPVDNVAGRILGKVLAEYFLYLCQPIPKAGDEVKPEPWHFGEFDGREFDGRYRFEPEAQAIAVAGPKGFYGYSNAADFDGDALLLTGTERAPVLKVLYGLAKEECLRLEIRFQSDQNA